MPRTASATTWLRPSASPVQLMKDDRVAIVMVSAARDAELEALERTKTLGQRKREVNETYAAWIAAPTSHRAARIDLPGIVCISGTPHPVATDHSLSSNLGTTETGSNYFERASRILSQCASSTCSGVITAQPAARIARADVGLGK